MKPTIVLYLLMALQLIACNQVTLNDLSASKVSVVAPSQMLTGHCTAWGISFTSDKGSLAKIKTAKTLSLSLKAGGLTLNDAEFFSDAACTQTISNLNVAAGAKSATIYLRYNIKKNLELVVSDSQFGSASANTAMGMDFTRTDRLAGQRVGIGNLPGVGADSSLTNPAGLATDGTYIYISLYRDHQIVKVHIASRVLSHVAGLYSHSGSTNGVGSNARFANPQGLTVLGSSLYVADRSNHVIRKIDLLTNTVSTFAGLAGNNGTVDGVGSAARLNGPGGITNDGVHLYVAEVASSTIRKIHATTGSVTTLAGLAAAPGSIDGVGSAARFSSPLHLDTDGTYLYIPDTANHTIRRLTISDGTVITLAGTAGMSGTTDDVGAAARFNIPYTARVDGGYLYIVDQNNHRIRRLDLGTNAVTTLTGAASGAGGYLEGSFATARFSGPQDIVVVGTKAYTVEYWQPNLRELDLTTQMTALMNGSYRDGIYAHVDGVGNSAAFDWGEHMTSDGTYLYVASCGSAIRRVHIQTRVVDTIVGQAGVNSSNDGVGTAATINCPTGITYSNNNLYIAEWARAIRKVDLATMNVTTIAGTAGAPAGGADGVGAAATFNYPEGVAVVGNDLYVIEYGGHILRKINLTTNAVTTVAGQYGVAVSADGNGTAATFLYPDGMIHLNGFLYIAEYGSHTIRKYNIATGDVTTIAGIANSAGFADGIGTAAKFIRPTSLASDGTYLYITDMVNHKIRRLDPQTNEVTTLLGPHNLIGDRVGSLQNTAVTWPTSIVWTPSGLFFGNDGTNVIWLH